MVGTSAGVVAAEEDPDFLVADGHGTVVKLDDETYRLDAAFDVVVDPNGAIREQLGSVALAIREVKVDGGAILDHPATIDLLTDPVDRERLMAGEAVRESVTLEAILLLDAVETGLTVMVEADGTIEPYIRRALGFSIKIVSEEIPDF